MPEQPQNGCVRDSVNTAAIIVGATSTAMYASTVAKGLASGTMSPETAMAMSFGMAALGAAGVAYNTRTPSRQSSSGTFAGDIEEGRGQSSGTRAP